MILELDGPPLPRRGMNGGGVLPLLPFNKGLLSGDASTGGEVARAALPFAVPLLDATAERAGADNKPLPLLAPVPLTAIARALTGGPATFAS